VGYQKSLFSQIALKNSDEFCELEQDFDWQQRLFDVLSYNGLAVLHRARDKIAGMLEIIELLTHYFVTLIKLLKPGGVKRVMAESIAMKHQLIVMNRERKRSPALVTRDRFLFGLLAILIGERRLQKIASSLSLQRFLPSIKHW
jgi:hypothetical protein